MVMGRQRDMAKVMGAFLQLLVANAPKTIQKYKEKETKDEEFQLIQKFVMILYRSS
jgi:hypothetical protein